MNPERIKTSPRETVRWSAIWFGPDGSAREGEICDISATGVFLRPVGSTVEELGAGARVRVRFHTRGHAVIIDAVGVVRWAGANRAHGCSGYGIELDEFNEDLDAYVRRGSDRDYADAVAGISAANLLASPSPA